MTAAFDRFVGRLVAALEAHLATGAPVALPEGSRPLWAAFCALSQARSYGALGPNPIAFSEIAAWAQLTRTPLAPHHVEALRALDRAWIAAAISKVEGGHAEQQNAPQPISAALIDAMFG